ncbi:MAG: hypothetical protein EAZ73_09065 [Oscillatoriales cyanobacterium]|uniref:hypothetical protein n=1 Tax=unclassified Microcoleus TaxID=2642155 RepID=UPI001DDC09FD|nr:MULTISPECIES: hypothetical protein [unclassified Microcoleus]TAF00873.1 MAG: hypothetical protein EAZ79_01530 [Oscillatoriales cyanobacterium]MCC3459788.1 hypothetical protein [Microcoleus sp. PH2017_11_PCY_U_A]MCC3478221.1 hypothetical protein [Microcoleus sp. PH2017_12_PCY_D_A]TAF21368.1 MAG: hypothetical protein EAZ73_09065 [Oscillatoriales cyanobacterium]TAF39705.1 MAG: hypothetical protein EAZ69_00280 [Oscillatoriales cyanobacterium]
MKKLDRNDLRTYPVQNKPCKTCPFAGETPLILPESDLVMFYKNLLGNGQHFCHSANNQKICRGGRNIQLQWLYLIGMLDEPTDKAFDETMNEVLNK